MKIQNLDNLNAVSFARMSKKESEEKHFKNACLNRVGEELDSKEITKLIKNHKLELIDKQSNIIKRWKYKHNNDYMIVYSKKTNQPVTVVPYKEEMENDDKNHYFWWLI